MHVAAVVALVFMVATGASACAARAPSTSGDDELKTRVEAALTRATDVNAAALVVETSGGVVTLTGRVVSGFEQQSVGAIVRAVPGVSDVRFSLSVEDPQAGR